MAVADGTVGVGAVAQPTVAAKLEVARGDPGFAAPHLLLADSRVTGAAYASSASWWTATTRT